MKKYFLAAVLALLLIGCTQQSVDNPDPMPLAEGDSCAVCGSGCIPSSMLPVTLCEPTTEEFNCEVVDGTCQRAE